MENTKIVTFCTTVIISLLILGVVADHKPYRGSLCPNTQFETIISGTY